MAVSRSLWDALSPAGEDTGIPCPKLESILITSYTNETVFTPLADCLRKRQTVGFKLRRFRMVDYHQLIADMDGFDEEFGPLVEVLEARKQSRFVQRVSAISTCGLDAYRSSSSGAKKLQYNGNRPKYRVSMQPLRT